MFKVIFWLIAALLLAVLPGVSIIMAMLYAVYAVVSPLFKRPRAALTAGADQDDRSKNVQVVIPDLNVDSARMQAAAYSAEAEALDIERDQNRREEELLAQNASHHQANIVSSYDHQMEDRSWQDRLEAEARR